MKTKDEVQTYLDSFYEKFDYGLELPYRLKDLATLEQDGFGHCADVTYNASLVGNEKFELPFTFARWDLIHPELGEVSHVGYLVKNSNSIRLYSHSSVSDLSVAKSFESLGAIFDYASAVLKRDNIIIEGSTYLDLSYNLRTKEKNITNLDFEMFRMHIIGGID